MLLTTQTIANILSENPSSANDTGGLVLAYLQLKQKLDHEDLQSYYFKKGLASNIQRLQKLKKSYDAKQKFFNSHSLHDLIQLKNEQQEIVDKLKSGPPISMITRIGLHGLLSSLNQLDELMALKRHIEILAEMDEYMTNTLLLIKLLETPAY